MNFVFAVLLKTFSITFHDSKYAAFQEFKVFYLDKLVEHYLFGLECGKLLENYWHKNAALDLYNEGCSDDEHYFKSSLRQVTEPQILSILLAERDHLHNRGFLDACLRYYQTYIPRYEEHPFISAMTLH